MNVLISKDNLSANIGKPVTASMPVDYHSAPTISPTGYDAPAWSNMGELVGMKDASDGSLWLEVKNEGETNYLAFVPGSFYILDGQGEPTKLKFFQKPLAVFGTLAGGILLFAVMVAVIMFNMAKNKQKA